MLLLRTLHRWGGLSLVALLVFYCLTGILMNHRQVFDYFLVRQNEKRTVEPVDIGELGRTINRYAQLTGESKPPAVVRITNDGTVELLYGSHGAVTYVFPSGKGEMEKIVKVPTRPWYWLNKLHKAAGTGSGWLTVADFAGVALLFLAGSGLFLMHWRRGDWLALMLGGTILLLGMYLA
jgi:hypothetical protein